MSSQPKFTAIQLLEGVAQRATGLSAEELRERPIGDLRRIVETRSKRRLKATTSFPFIGRGNVMLDKILSHDRVETLLDDALKE